MKVRNQYNFISKSKLLWPTWSDQVSKLWKVIFVFYCIYTDVKRSIRKGNNPKVFCWSGMSGPDRKSVPVLFNNAGLTINTSGKEIQIIRCNMHATEHETRKVASCIHIVRECSSKCNFKKFKPTWIRPSEHFIEKTSPDITISEASLEIAVKITFNWLIKKHIKNCTLVALWLQPYYGP